MTDTKKIYLIDDEEAIRHSASFMLRHAGFAVDTYSNGPDFLSGLDNDVQGCVLLDVRMPEMDGLTVLSRIRDVSATLPVIILTGHGDVSTAVAAMKNGATDFLEKPFEKTAILKSIDEAFARIEMGAAQQETQRMARARASRLAWPPESKRPDSPTQVSSPLGRVRTNSLR